MKEITYNDICSNIIGSPILHTHEPFIKDYLVIHQLIKMYKPKSIMEIGTNVGEGTNIICNANPKMKVFSLDLPYELSHVSKQSPVSEGKGESTGSKCMFPFTQLWSDSTVYDYSEHYPLEAWYIDGEHNYNNPFKETLAAIKSGAKLIIWHDTNIPCVYEAIVDAFDCNCDYDLFRVVDTRISYAVRK